MTKTLTPKELAQELNSDPRTVRKFLRAQARENGTETPGKGSRWAIEARTVRSLRKSFNAWIEAKAPKADEEPEVSEETEDA